MCFHVRLITDKRSPKIKVEKMAGLPRVVCLSALCALASHVRANDEIVTLGAGGLVPVKSPTVVMESDDDG